MVEWHHNLDVYDADFTPPKDPVHIDVVDPILPDKLFADLLLDQIPQPDPLLPPVADEGAHNPQ